MLSPKYIALPLVQSLSLNQTIRLTHDCSVSGRSKNLSITREAHGLVYNCFKCGDAGYYPLSVRPVPTKPRPKRIHKIPSTATGEITRWKRPVAEWVRKYLHDTEVTVYGLVSDDYELYIPISGDSFLARSFDPVWSGPKWIKRGDSKHYAVKGMTNICVITEDCISAMCIACLDVNAIALLCTSINDDTVAYIASQNFSRAVIWLDDDNTVVRRAQNKIRSRLSLVVPKVDIVHAGTDPKNIPRTDLHSFIW